jgi:hypothetical protein
MDDRRKKKGLRPDSAHRPNTFIFCWRGDISLNPIRKRFCNPLEYFNNGDDHGASFNLTKPHLSRLNGKNREGVGSATSFLDIFVAGSHRYSFANDSKSKDLKELDDHSRAAGQH